VQNIRNKFYPTDRL